MLLDDACFTHIACRVGNAIELFYGQRSHTNRHNHLIKPRISGGYHTAWSE